VVPSLEKQLKMATSASSSGSGGSGGGGGGGISSEQVLCLENSLKKLEDLEGSIKGDVIDNSSVLATKMYVVIIQ
jgi:hypothetical protein